jgi:cephalosporin hydroxylase
MNMKANTAIIDRATESLVSWARGVRFWIRDMRQAIGLSLRPAKRNAVNAEFLSASSVSEISNFTSKYMDSGICQLPSEIEPALSEVATIKPRTLCEIGTATGGNSLLMSRLLDSIDYMICIDLYVRNKAYLKLLRRPGLSIAFINASSYAPRTVKNVAKLLKGRKIDVLFIDGDHRYEGVLKDFLLYRDFVQEGGYILFHDIVLDQEDGWIYSGGVPILWEQLRDHYPTKEFVQSRDQKGFGIGLLRYSREAMLPARFDDIR